MLDQTKQTIENRILADFPAGHSYSRAQIQQAKLPSGVKHFLVSTLQRRSEIEAAELLSVRSEWFNADDDEYQLVLQQAVLTLGNLACFPASEWPKAVHQAVEHVVEYLISPVSMLVRFVFPADSPSISASDLLRKTGYFSDYPYISRSVEAYLSRKKTQRIFKVEFANALFQVDRQITDQYDSKSWLKLLNPLMKLVELPSPGLPVLFVVRFFEDKGQGKLSRFIQEAAAAKQAELVSLDSLRELIDHFLNDTFEQTKIEQNSIEQTKIEPIQAEPPIAHPTQVEQTKADPSKVEAEIESETIATSTPIHPEVVALTEPKLNPPLPDLAPPVATQSVAVEPETPSPKVALPLWKKFQKADAPPQPVDTSNTPEPLWKAFSRKKEEKAEREKLDMASVMPHTDPKPDLCALVLGSEGAHKERFVWQLFAGNHAAFDETMQFLATAPDWTSASEIIANKVFRPFKVDIYSATAVDFTNAVESRYSGLRS